MELDPIPTIISSERLGDGLLIFFADGKGAFYPTKLLYPMLELADPINVEEPKE
jgi:hypothetical protein